ncbi:CACTA en-spm transposon protein [Cucumis melo var. makuwa]|uniref:CACTA en-spm transposon protein n=1 Tax=Cucumis melo var. makuwa TaxID=1194695 RepID=A0A5D3C8M8_CUCMM|nr:CACTA en-spm transposon protein [Cucumis melo var. makuwa]TYK07642.1 CACTA en-spm transposon protein [Cucumis melo var. makuwa]
MDGHIEDETLCRTNVDPTIVERSVVRHIIDDFIDDVDKHFSHASIMSSSYPRNNFLETDAMFLEFEDDLDNLKGGSSSVGDNSGSSTQPPATPIPKRHVQSQILKLECYVAVNGHIPMTIAPGVEKSISSHVLHFSQAIDVCRLFVLDFNDQAMNRFVEHQMFSTSKEFQTDYHKYFKKYSNLEEACASPPNILVGRYED